LCFLFSGFGLDICNIWGSMDEGVVVLHVMLYISIGMRNAS
jgi:hypothetical protein